MTQDVLATTNGFSKDAAAEAAVDSLAATLRDNPLCAPWSGPFEGVPPFDRASVANIRSALRAGMEQHLLEVASIAGDNSPATFENTIAAFERTGAALNRAKRVYDTLCSSASSDELRALQGEIDSEIAAHYDKVMQNERLFSRVAEVFHDQDGRALSPEQKRLVDLLYKRFKGAGAALNSEQKSELSAINQNLAALCTRFSQNVLKAESQAIVITEESQLAGLPSSIKEAMASAAQDLGQSGAWALVNTRSIIEPVLTHSPNRELRKQAFDLFASRGDGGEYDNNSIITEILQLRARRAHLLGYQSHAHEQLEDTMAQTPERALKLLLDVWEPAVARLRKEIAEASTIAQREGMLGSLEPWDLRYYQEKVRSEQYDLNESDITPYLQLDKLRDGMFYTASKLFGLSFAPLAVGVVPTIHPSVEVWEAKNAQGEHIGLLYFDPCWRDGKRSGAWMSDYRMQQRLDGEVSAIVSNNCNFMQGQPGEATLLSWRDAETLFHEFGHALHGLLSNVTYPLLSGTQVSGDFVELPSQLFECWLETPEVLNRFALHHKTGEPMPQELVAKILRAKNFNAGFTTVEYLACAVVDMQIHLEGEGPINPADFERDALSTLGLPREVIMRHRLPHFQHLFADDEYSAGYYSYLWADTLAADAWEGFLDASGPWDLSVGHRLLQEVLSTGNTRDPRESYRAFRGRDADASALMRRRGLT
jgi:peptidyl-dipeptidase Dcp